MQDKCKKVAIVDGIEVNPLEEEPQPELEAEAEDPTTGGEELDI